MKNKIITILIPILLYPISTFIGQWISNDFHYGSLLTLTLAAVLFYQWEIPMFFKAVEEYRASDKLYSKLKLFFNEEKAINPIGKTAAATLYFNPLWISRHMIFITLGAVPLASINWIELIDTSIRKGSMSFLVTMPVVLIGNYIVQNKISLEKRFLGNAVLSGILVLAYAIGYKFF